MHFKKYISTLLLLLRHRRHVWRGFVPLALVALFLPVLVWLPWEAQHAESDERQEQLIADTLWVEQTIRFQLARDEESMRLLATDIAARHLTAMQFVERAMTLRRNNRELAQIAWLDENHRTVVSTGAIPLAWSDLSAASQATDATARSARIARYSGPAVAGDGAYVIDYHVPVVVGDRVTGTVIARFSVTSILSEIVPWWFAQDNEITLADSDDHVVGRRAAGGNGRGVYTHSRTLDLPGLPLALRTNSVKSAPRLMPNLLVVSVMLLSLGLFWSLWALWRDIARRIAAEAALRQQMAFRTAMENSLLTGLRARDLEGRITYVNPAFCDMVGLPAEQLVGRRPPMPYWAPEAMGEYQHRLSQVLAGSVTPQYETIFQRAGGERFPVLIFESPLIDETGRQTGWMGSILDITDRKAAEALNRQQQEKLQSSARLAAMGEIASTLAHELNQPLAAISSYTTGAINLLDQPRRADGVPDMLRQALDKANTQAQRAGNIIRSVHAFVKKREAMREPLSITEIIDGVMPLVELQARQAMVVIQTEIAAGLPQVLADRILLEQVLLNLTRNAIDAMSATSPGLRILHIAAAPDTSAAAPAVVISVTDRGHGIAPDVADRLFSPFFSTKAEGMGMGLNICRSAAEFHGGTLTHLPNPAGGTIFRFSLPALVVPAAPAVTAGEASAADGRPTRSTANS